MSVEISIIITNYNREQYIGRAIRSCLKQSMPKGKYEIIVVDDNSTDNSIEVIKSFGDKVVLIQNEENVGVAEASNIGIRNAMGMYIIRVDSDDYINEHTLLFLSELLDKNQDLGFVYADHLRVDRTEKAIERVNLDTPDKIFRHGAGIMFRKSYLETLGLYDSSLRNAEDYDLLKRYIKNFNGYHLPLPLYRYRQHDYNMTNDDEARKKWEAISDLKRQHEDWE